MSFKNGWDCVSWDELKANVTLDEIRKALYAAERNRSYHKTQYLKRQSILAKAKAAGITADSIDDEL